MYTANRTMVLGVTALVTLGLLYSQLCSIRCTVYVCSPPAPAQIAQHSKPSSSSHCGHDSAPEQNVPAEQEHSDSDTCLTHAEVTALLPPGPSLAASLQDQLQAPCVEPLFTAFAQPDALMVESAVPPPDRSPPRAAFSVLRI